MAAPQKYPWDEWFDDVDDGWTLYMSKGDQFDCQPHCMSVMIRAQAAKRKIPITVLIDGNTVSMQKRED